MQSKDHWEKVYSTKTANSVSWFQEHAETSLNIIQSTRIKKDAAIIDVGGGASTLVDDLLSNGYSNLTVLDLSATALAAAKQRLGAQSDRVNWIESDITKTDFPANQFDVWHDRAVFHFLTDAKARMDHLKARVPDATDITLERLLQESPSMVPETFASSATPSPAHYLTPSSGTAPAT